MAYFILKQSESLSLAASRVARRANQPPYWERPEGAKARLVTFGIDSFFLLSSGFLDNAPLLLC